MSMLRRAIENIKKMVGIDAPALACPLLYSNTFLNPAQTGMQSPQWDTFTDSSDVLAIAVTAATAPRAAGSSVESFPTLDLARANEFFANQSALAGQSVNVLGTIPRTGSAIIGLGEFEITSCDAAQQFGLQLIGEGSSNLGTAPIMILSAGISFRCYTGTSASYELSHSVFQQNTADATYNITNSNESMFIVSGAPTFPVRIAMYFNQNTKQIGFTSSLTGDVGYIDSMDAAMTSTGGTHTPSPAVVWSASTPEITGFTVCPRVWPDSGDIQPCAATLYKKATDWTCTYPAGTIDTCGNVKA